MTLGSNPNMGVKKGKILSLTQEDARIMANGESLIGESGQPRELDIGH